MRTRRPILILTSVTTLAGAVLLGACGGTGGAAGDDGVASLGTTTTLAPTATVTGTVADEATGDDSTAAAGDDSLADDSPAPEPAGSEPAGSEPAGSDPPSSDPPSSDPEEAMLQYVECMREHGIDMPDPEPGGGILMTQEDDGDGASLDAEEMQEAQQACEPLLEASMGDFEPDPEQEAEMREQMLAYAECMREHGIDMPDPQFGENGQVSIQIGEPGGPDAAPDSDEFEAANEACGQEGSSVGIAVGPGGGESDAADDGGE